MFKLRVCCFILLYTTSIDGSVVMSLIDKDDVGHAVSLEIVQCDLPVYCISTFVVEKFLFLAIGGMWRGVKLYVQNEYYETMLILEIALKSPVMTVCFDIEEVGKEELVYKICIYAGCQDSVIYQSTCFVTVAGDQFNSSISSSRRLIGHKSDIRDLKIANNKLISSSDDGDIRIWDLDIYECVKCLEKHANSIISVDCRGDILISCGTDRKIAIWNLNNLKDNIFTIRSNIKINVVKIIDELLYTCGADGFLSIYSIVENQLILTQKLHEGSVLDISYLQPNKIATIGKDNLIKLWNINRPELQV